MACWFVNLCSWIATLKSPRWPGGMGEALMNPPRCRSSCRRAREPSEPLRRSSLSCLHDNAGMTLVIPSVGCVSAKSSDRAPVCTGSSFSCKSVVLPQRQRLCPRTAASLPGAPFRALGRGFYSCLSSWRILGSNSPLSVPDLVLLAVPKPLPVVMKASASCL